MGSLILMEPMTGPVPAAILEAYQAQPLPPQCLTPPVTSSTSVAPRVRLCSSEAAMRGCYPAWFMNASAFMNKALPGSGVCRCRQKGGRPW